MMSDPMYSPGAAASTTNSEQRSAGGTVDPSLAETDRQLIEYGYEPVAIIGKAPKNDEWRQRENTIEAITADRAAMPSATNTGLRTGRLVAIDIDAEPGPEAPPGSDNPDHTREVMALVQEMLGESFMVRVGRKGCAILYRNATPIQKITIKGDHPRFKRPRKQAPNHGWGGGQVKTPTQRPHQIAVEILGQGQQVAAYGPHPDTGKPYQWTYSVAAYEPLQIPMASCRKSCPNSSASLPLGARRCLNSSATSMWRATNSGENAGAREAKRREDKAPVPREYLVEMLKLIPASNYDGDRNGWIGILGAIQATRLVGLDDGDAMDRELVAIADEWSSQGASYVSRYDVEQTYDDLRLDKEGGTTFGTLYHLAKEAGWTEPPPQEEFSASEKFGEGGTTGNKGDTGTAWAPPKKRMTLRSAAADEPEAIDWLWKDYLARGKLHIIGGTKGDGKSTTAFDLSSRRLPLPTENCQMDRRPPAATC